MRKQRTRDQEFNAFVEANLRQLVVFGLTLSPSEHDAWDMTQDALLKVYARWANIDAPMAYTRRVMARLNIDQSRRRGRELLGAVPEKGTCPVYLEPPDVRLIEALAELSAQQRTAIALRYLLDLDIAAISQTMKCSEGTVRSHLSRGTARLRAMKEFDEIRRGE